MQIRIGVVYFIEMCELPLILLERLRFVAVEPAASGWWFLLFRWQFLLSLRINDLDSVNGGGPFAASNPFRCVAAICELTFHGQANGGAFVSCGINANALVWFCATQLTAVQKQHVLVYFYYGWCCCCYWAPADSSWHISFRSDDAANHYLSLDYRASPDSMHLRWMLHSNRWYLVSPHHCLHDQSHRRKKGRER